MPGNLTTRDRKFLLYGGIAVSAILLYFFAVEPARNSYLEIQGEIPRVSEMKQRFQAVLDGGKAQEKRKEFMDAEFKRLVDACFIGETEALATGQLADVVRKKAAAAKLKVKSSKAEKPSTLGEFQIINLEVTFNASLANLANLMKAIENGPKKILIREAKLSLINEVYPNDKPEVLTMKLLLSGLRYIKR